MTERYASLGRPYLPDRSHHTEDPLPPSHPGAPPCAACRHPRCRAIRASTQVIRGGQRQEFAAEHQRVALVQKRHPGVVLWFGEYTQLYWAATPTGLHQAESMADLLVLVWCYARNVVDTPPPPSVEGRSSQPPPSPPRGQPRGGSPVPPLRSLLYGVLVG